MSVRSLGYDSDNLDQIICYFMRTIIAIYYQPKIYGGIPSLNMLLVHFILTYRKM